MVTSGYFIWALFFELLSEELGRRKGIWLMMDCSGIGWIAYFLAISFRKRFRKYKIVSNFCLIFDTFDKSPVLLMDFVQKIIISKTLISV